MFDLFSLLTFWFVCWLFGLKNVLACLGTFFLVILIFAAVGPPM